MPALISGQLVGRCSYQESPSLDLLLVNVNNASLMLAHLLELEFPESLGQLPNLT